MSRRQLHNPFGHWRNTLFVALLLTSLPAGAVNVVVQLKNGDRITGQLVTQETNQVVIATTWANPLVLPISIIGGLRTAEGTVLYAPPPPPAPPVTNSPVAQAKPKPKIGRAHV